jgi:hypothetical protein
MDAKTLSGRRRTTPMTPFLNDSEALLLVDLLHADAERREQAGAAPSAEANRILARLLKLLERDTGVLA